ncbi:multidrug effflux MFS transporter [Achromobacter sp. Bel]|uniref:multidrug effflux MFS transporter n=1 Tax=Achromobacter sp. Bel TaxID=2727415 RepID=UPI00145EC2E9|nr:multidrug effflux MFS transporter [Achromobacter sp. Bel]NMK46800.1 multidrug effflux MFS transporter [Achromobacter sp. Bel]
MKHPSRDGLPPRGLILALLALPQIAETILAPALPDLARHWRLDAGAAQSVMGIFFLGFALGVLLWGHLADAWGRRPALLAGLATGLAGTLCALIAPSFEGLLLGRFIQAAGLATCSVTTQTLLRDRLSGDTLTRYFVTLGAVLAWSPAVGPLVGQLVSDRLGYQGVLLAIALVIFLLLAQSGRQLPETRGAATAAVPLRALAHRMLADAPLRRAAVLVAGLNFLVFSFYSAGPFMTGPLSGLGFGWVGLAVAAAGCLGAASNRRLPAQAAPAQRVRYGLRCILAGVLAQGAIVLVNPQPGPMWAIAALPIFAGYGLAIPNLLGPALRQYGHSLGRAGALFGLAYYAMLGTGLAASSWLPFHSALPLSGTWLVVCALLLHTHRRDQPRAPARSSN